MAFESPRITGACVEATEFMELSQKYRVRAVPKTMVNGIGEILGAVPEEIFVKTVVETSRDAESTATE